MRSRLYECRVMHARHEPRRHRFVHRIFMLAVDLDELPELHRASGLLAVNAPGLYSFREDDHFPADEPLHQPTAPEAVVAPRPSLARRVRDHLSSHGIDAEGGRIVLVTMPRIAGYLFNPVSFYFCHDAAGRPVAAIAEVTNTFREVKTFLLPASTLSDGAFRLRVPKHFYVSPFSDVDVSFDFVLRPPGRRLAIRIDDFAGARRTLSSTLTGEARPLTTAMLAWYSVKHPLQTLAVMGLIHLHALVLWLKRVPWFAKAARPQDQRDLRRPHRSILPPAATDRRATTLHTTAAQKVV